MGWVAARIDIKSLLSESRALPSSYFKGLNFLLKEQPDRAIESFLQVAKENPQTVELQFALGSLFRRRGEVDRAIRLHQSLVARPGLSDEQKTRAVLALGEDYMRAGLLDRAETLFTDLVRMGVLTNKAVYRSALAKMVEERTQKNPTATGKAPVTSGGKDTYKAELSHPCWWIWLAWNPPERMRIDQLPANLVRPVLRDRNGCSGSAGNRN